MHLGGFVGASHHTRPAALAQRGVDRGNVPQRVDGARSVRAGQHARPAAGAQLGGYGCHQWRNGHLFVREQLERLGCGCAGLGHRLGAIFGSLGRPANKDVFHRRIGWANLGVKFLYETNVGAGLPVITTLKDLKISGDWIIKVEGVLSGTLSYIFNTFNGRKRFSEIVAEAKDKGFTEPDPRNDMNGLDVVRKILILSREVGYEMEIGEIDNQPLLPESCFRKESIPEFFEELKKQDDHFEALRKKAEEEGKKLRFVATLEEGKARVGLTSVGPEHPLYSLSGSDNMISFTTSRYQERPLVIKGPGAGGEVTAAGVFAEIISIANSLP